MGERVVPVDIDHRPAKRAKRSTGAKKQSSEGNTERERDCLSRSRRHVRLISCGMLQAKGDRLERRKNNAIARGRAAPGARRRAASSARRRAASSARRTSASPKLSTINDLRQVLGHLALKSSATDLYRAERKQVLTRGGAHKGGVSAILGRKVLAYTREVLTVPLMAMTHLNTGAPRPSSRVSVVFVFGVPRQDPVMLITVLEDTLVVDAGSTPVTDGADVHTSTGTLQSSPVQPP